MTVDTHATEAETSSRATANKVLGRLLYPVCMWSSSSFIKIAIFARPRDRLASSVSGRYVDVTCRAEVVAGCGPRATTASQVSLPVSPRLEVDPHQ